MDRKRQTGVATNIGIVECEMMDADSLVCSPGVSLKHLSVTVARILVIDDSESDVFLLDRALKKQDLQFQLIHLISGTEALAFIRGHGAYADVSTPSLILLDLNLSKYTGEDILREIRNAPHLADVVVCVWSSSRSRQDESLLKSLGVSRFITKPSGLGQFMEIGKIIEDLLGRAETSA